MPYATVDRSTIYYESAGAGFPLILLHGIGSNSKSWHRQLAAFSDRFQVVAWDAPGYGRSSDPAATEPSIRFYADRLHALLKTLSLPQVFLLGHSMGSVIAQEFNGAYPSLVRSLVLADTPRTPAPEKLEARLHMIRTMTPAQLAAARAPKLLTRGAPQPLVQEAISIMSEVRPAGYEFAAIALSRADTRDVLERLRIPALLIWGAEDEITPVWDEVPRGTRLEIIPHAGHLCYAEQPALFNSIVTEFLR